LGGMTRDLAQAWVEFLELIMHVPGSLHIKREDWDCNGIDGGSSSMEIVLEWLTTGTNYQRWRGDLEEGKTKKSSCSKIIQMMNDNGINHRDAKGMYTSPFFWFLPMSNLQSSYKSACDWKQNTGAGILDSDVVNGVKAVDGTSAFHPVAHRFMNLILFLDQIHALCRYWDILDPIMGSRSVAKPFTRSLVSNQQTEELPNLTSINPRNETTLDTEDEDINLTDDALPNLPHRDQPQMNKVQRRKPIINDLQVTVPFPARKEGRGKKNEPQGILHAISHYQKTGRDEKSTSDSN
ncbi:hypothetical protein VP01_4625g1, partial [Puccinia sorghi]